MAGKVELTERKTLHDDFTHTIATWAPVSPAIAFDYVADIARHPEWALDPVTIEPLDEPSVHLGSRFRAIGHQGGRDWPSEIVVTAFDRPTRFAFTATGGPIPTTEGHLHRHEFTFLDERGGTTLVVRRTDPFPNRAVRLLAPLIASYALRHRLRTIERLRQRLEGLRPTG